MNSKSQLARASILLLTFSSTAFTLPGCGSDVGAEQLIAKPSPAPRVESAAPHAAMVTVEERDLLDVAFEVASAIPTKPHIKDRSRAQAAVVDCCLELAQPARALGFIERIDDWRRGVAYTDVAFDQARRGERAPAEQALKQAERVLEHAPGEESQDWQLDRIRAGIARAYVALGDRDRAAHFENGVDDSQLGSVLTAKALDDGGESIDAQLVNVDALVATGNFDLVQSALETCVGLHERHYADATRRKALEERIQASWAKLPIVVRVELMLKLCRTALAHDDREGAIALLDQVQPILDASRSSTETRVPLAAKIAGLRGLAGEVEHARKDLVAVLAQYESERNSLLNIFRAGMLKSLAEAYHTLGDKDAALDLYKRAVREAAENPNARPRAEDLAAICCSLAAHGVEPDAELRGQITSVQAGLKAPW